MTAFFQVVFVLFVNMEGRGVGGQAKAVPVLRPDVSTLANAMHIPSQICVRFLMFLKASKL